MLVELAWEHGCRPFTNILYGIPICYTKLPTIYRLKEKLLASDGGGDLHVLVDNEAQVNFLEDFIRTFGFTLGESLKWSVFLKIDTGYHRAGVTCDKEGVFLASRIIKSSYLTLQGLYSHWWVVSG
jgi:D-serine deaminase-like pyridoxal phosphate-dependent protein